jgi:Flp pilus assembly CpaF family ATPase
MLQLPQLSEQENSLILEIEEKFKEESRTKSISSKKESEEFISKLISDHSYRNGVFIDKGQLGYLSRIAALHIYGLGPLEALVEDNEIEEISVIGLDKPIYVFMRNRGWQSVNASITTEKEISELVNKMSASIGRRITLQNPRIDAMLANGSRLHASLPPISEGEITIRKFRERPFSPAEIVENGTSSAKAMAFLSLLMHSDSSLLVAGNTASGKTTTLNALFSFVPANERVLITEETPEINIPHQHRLRLVANKEMGIMLKDLVYDSLRMRPDRIIVGEIRNREECEALFDVLLAGQARGSYATMHGRSARETLQRIKSFGIGESDIASIDAIAVQRRMLVYDKKAKRNLEIRRVVEIAEVGDGFATIFSFNGKELVYKKSQAMLDKLAGKLSLSRKEVEEELALREKLVKTTKGSFSEFFKKVQAQLYGLNDA